LIPVPADGPWSSSGSRPFTSRTFFQSHQEGASPSDPRFLWWRDFIYQCLICMDSRCLWLHFFETLSHRHPIVPAIFFSIGSIHNSCRPFSRWIWSMRFSSQNFWAFFLENVGLSRFVELFHIIGRVCLIS
jgi:hypothetical protein